MGILTVGVVIIPFYFDKNRKIKNALPGVMEMEKNIGTFLIVNNERLCDVYPDSEICVKKAFKRAGNAIYKGSQGFGMRAHVNLWSLRIHKRDNI
ncbi:MAG: hypothetical protein NC344_04810 [Bacteroidales bacterium]|nr:hypothetical protein [Bacteroidales bacterium]MCM1147146.1 hypothetical protein [Bacteroidales bacterium]MCM1205372.1 hypothetical protein [Bacillota bacterium]MCM1509823.1 hypothetical protein [Clostridium sp.]